MSEDKTARIRELNDRFRQYLVGGKVVFTSGILETPDLDANDVARAVMTFNNFTAYNDPYGEHDFGAVEVSSHKLFWKIDYYDPTMEHASEDPSDPALTRRVMTIMLAEEY